MNTPDGPRTGLSVDSKLYVRIVLLIAAICAGAVLRLVDLNAPARSPDEQHYTAQATLLLSQGRSAFPILVAAFERDPSTPSPQRAGFLYILAGVMAITNRRDVMAGVWLACAASILSLLLVARLAWRFLNPTAAVIALTFYAASPLPLMTGRRAWQDALVETLVLILLLTAGEIVSGGCRWPWSLAFAVTGAVCITMKEIPAAAFLLITVWVLWSLRRSRSIPRQVALFCLFWIGSTAAALAWLTFLLGGARLLIELPRLTSAYIAVSPYSQAWESGTVWDLIHGFWTVSPFTVLGFPLGLAALALPRFFTNRDQPHRGVAIFLAGFTALVVAAALLTPHHLNFRYMCPAFGPCYLIAGLGFAWAADVIALRLSASHRAVFAACSVFVIVLCAGSDAYTFQRRFMRPDLQDLSIRMVLTGSNR